ncbi:anti-sigma factor family protein [Crassaminicella profunda]|uniref:anti-sigma factor family protein n=1 Tax=Crassaminicella profunda TaxID=1286698 RepID=UPI001CA6BAA4|nr:DUF4367 domain-containing protein [Crassaminicella profunda]QZY55177.1 hypothetical protein K7H06_19595 [Crassaminicella profunda]
MCYEIEVFQQIIDNTYEGRIDEVFSHIETCPHCKETFERLKKQEELVGNVLNKGLMIPQRRPIHVVNKNQRRIFKMNQLAKKWTAVAAVALICTSLLFVDPIRAKAQDLLKIFRIQEMKTVSISESDIREIDEIFRKGSGSKEIENFIKVDVSSGGKEINIENPNIEAIKENMSSAKVINLKDGFEYDYASIYPKQEITMKLNIDKANEFLNYLGEETQLPNTLDNKPFSILSENVLSYSIKSKNESKDKGRKSIWVTQMKAPTIEIPSDVDEQQLIKSLFSMNFLPNNIKEQFLDMNNIPSTIPIVYNPDKQTKEEVNIRGEKGILIKNKDSRDYYNLYFKQGDTIYSIGSNYDIDEVLSMVEEMK